MEILISSENSAVYRKQEINLLDQIPAMVSFVTPSLTYAYLNKAFLQFYQCTREAVIGKHVAELLGQEVYQAVQLYMHKALEGERCCFDLRISKNDIDEYFEARFLPDRDDDGQVLGFTSYIVRANEKIEQLLRKMEDLRRSEERYHQMVQEVEDYAIILLDRAGNIQDWNKGAEKVKGYTKEEIQGKNFRIFYAAEDRERKLPDQLLQEAAQKGKANHEGWRLRKDGSRFWGAITITALHDDSGGIIGYSKVTRDLTERKAAEEKQFRYNIELQQKNELLRKNEERYHKMIAEVEDYAIILLDRHGNIQNWNRGAENIKGYQAEEVLGKHFSLFYPYEDRLNKLPNTLLTEAVNKGKANHEGWRLKKDGSRFWGSVVITALHGANNEIIGFSKMTRDLTERKASEEKQLRSNLELQIKNEELRRSEERYHKMIAEVEDYAIILLDPEGYIQNWNKGAERIKGYKGEEIIGRHISTFYTPEDRERKHPQHLIDEARHNGTAHDEGWRMKKDGGRFWGSVVITALHDENRDIIGFSKMTRDLTERKIAEDRQKLNAQQLEAQNKELEQFAYVASHDLQEPLRKIRTFNSLITELEGDKLSDKAKDYFARSVSAADRMNQLIEDLLTYSRATRDTHKTEPVDLNVIVDQVRASYKESNRDVIIESDDLPVMEGMRFQFQQLFENLIGNGIKYQKPGNKPVIRIDYDKVAGNTIEGKGFGAASLFHHFRFIDNGIGFEQEYAEKIFEMFQRLHGRSEFAGSGIGLAIVKKIVQNYSGYVMAESTPGKGSVFHVYFPAIA